MGETPGVAMPPERDRPHNEGTPTDPEIVELDRAEAMRLLASVSYGRVVFTWAALPAIRAVNHLVDGNLIIVRTKVTTKMFTAMRSGGDPNVVVAYQADDIDPQRRAGWSVVATGRATTVTDPEDVRRYERMLHPWVNHADTVVAIEAHIVTGIRILPSEEPSAYESPRRNSH